MCAKIVKEEDYEEELCLTKSDNEREAQQRDFIKYQDELKTADIRELHQKAPHIKEEQQGDNTNIPLIGLIVKNEEDKDASQRSPPHSNQSEESWAEPADNVSSQSITEVYRDQCGQSKADDLLAPLSDSDEITSHAPDTDNVGGQPRGLEDVSLKLKEPESSSFSQRKNWREIPQRFQ
ncbi:uncharacterized protein LOC130926513 isoform X2 [Corythoichthys intestinalis]|uniref:uncharacterized protein LOC130926513 isoform X2 n=1 Tax=Corythoichthys intestinalis TaxID=161448 RepID=UPI0025A4EAD8|nr:uncharacterized protein LOC130926513 isoform X2 [Corythoichthys intestinalis]